MAVPESCPPVPVARNTMRLVAQTVVQAEGVQRGVVGRFRQSSNKDFLLAKETSLVLACPNEDGELLTQHTQPVHGTTLDLKLVHAPQHANSRQVRQCRCWWTSSTASLQAWLLRRVQWQESGLLCVGNRQGCAIDHIWQLEYHPV